MMGAVMLRATFRAARIMFGMQEEQAEAIGIEQFWRYSRIEGHKENYAPPPDQVAWYKLESQALGNGAGIYIDGDNVQVFTREEVVDSKDWSSKIGLVEVFDRLRKGPIPGEFYSRYKNSHHWAGTMIKEITGKTEPQVASLLKSWRKNNVVIDDVYRSAARDNKLTPYILPNEFKPPFHLVFERPDRSIRHRPVTTKPPLHCPLRVPR